MGLTELREDIHRLVDKADYKLLEAIYAVIEENRTAPEWFHEELNQRRTRHHIGKSKSYSWEDIKRELNDL
jgi:fructose-1,6-bisphosphatase/inositol monophosphatase family enzyme